MKIQVIKTTKTGSSIGTDRYYNVLFYCYDDEKYYRCFIYPHFRNFARWKNIDQVGTVYSGARLKKSGTKELIDADSMVTYQGNQPLPEIKKRSSNQIKLFN